MKIAIASDHTGVELKSEIIKYLKELGHEVSDFGTNSAESIDYPIYGKKVAEEISKGNYDGGVLICGTGIGMSIAANKVSGIRAAHVTDCYSARMAKQHNNAHIICLGERITGIVFTKQIQN